MERAIAVYRCRWLYNYIVEQCEKSGVSNTASLEERVINNVGAFLIKDPANTKKKIFLKKEVRKIVLYDKERFRKEMAIGFSELTEQDSEGNKQEYEPEDVLANVESDVITKRTIHLLAQADRRKLKVLNHWVQGNTIDSDISIALQRDFGGNAESHRKMIQRFRKECNRTLLSTAVI